MIRNIIPVNELIEQLEEGRQKGWCNGVNCDFVVDTLDVLRAIADYEIKTVEDADWWENIEDYVESHFKGYKLDWSGNTYNYCAPLSNDLSERVFEGEEDIIYAAAVNLRGDVRANYSPWILFKFEDIEELHEVVNDSCRKYIDFEYKGHNAYVEIEPFGGEYHSVHVPDLDVYFESYNIDLDEIREQIDTELSIP